MPRGANNNGGGDRAAGVPAGSSAANSGGGVANGDILHSLELSLAPILGHGVPLRG